MGIFQVYILENFPKNNRPLRGKKKQDFFLGCFCKHTCKSKKTLSRLLFSIRSNPISTKEEQPMMELVHQFIAERKYPPPSGDLSRDRRGVFSSGGVLTDFYMNLKIVVSPLESDLNGFGNVKNRLRRSNLIRSPGDRRGYFRPAIN